MACAGMPVGACRAGRGRRPGSLRIKSRCSAYPNVHRRTPAQVSVVHVPPWTALDLGELQLKLQLEHGTGRVRSVTAVASASPPGGP